MAKSGCCGGVTCGCVLTSGTGVTITGGGTDADPFEISANSELATVDNTVFDLTLNGTGTPADPYELEVDFASTSSVRDLGDVDDTVPTNGQVLVWNSALLRYEPGSNTPAAVGSVSHDTSLTGDGSVGDILEVVHDPVRFTNTGADGVGLDDEGINRLVRRFPDSATRAAADPAPELNSFSVVDVDPGHLDYWDGTGWVPADDLPDVIGSTFLELSGPYAGGRVRSIIKNLSVTTAGDGTFTALSSADLAGVAGVLDVRIQPVGSVMFTSLLSTSSGAVVGTAYRPDTGAAYPTQGISALVTAVVYD